MSAWRVPSPARPADDEYLASVTIGEREPLDDRIRLVAYDERWPSMFTAAAEKVHAALGEKMLLIEHVGSTAVPGLSAKPIVDIVLTVADAADEPSYVPSLQDEGFVLRIREPHWFEHRLLTLTLNDMVWQLHVFPAGCEEVERMVAFRDWLRTNDSDRRLYESTKRTLAARTWRHVQNYADAKSDVIREILERARGTTA